MSRKEQFESDLYDQVIYWQQVILMQINLNTSQQIFPLLSPIFQHTSMLSPLQEDTLRKYSYNYEEFGHFRLEACQDEDYLLLQIKQVEQKIESNENDKIEEKVQDQKEQDIQEKNDEKMMVNQKISPVQEKNEIEMQNELNSDSQKEQFQERLNSDRPYTELEKLIQHLIRKFDKDQNEIKSQLLKQYQEKYHEIYSEIISVLLRKFKKTKKTKEQMVKYCMRKAFKYIADKMKKNRTHNRDIDSCMRMYFSKTQTNNNFSIPFKKNSTEKTMNGSFLKRIFSSETFVEDYKEFLHEFHGLIQQDNYRKIKYLADLIDSYLKTDQAKKIQTIKRLPWTQQMLDQTLQLSKTLLEYAQNDSPLCTGSRRKMQ